LDRIYQHSIISVTDNSAGAVVSLNKYRDTGDRHMSYNNDYAEESNIICIDGNENELIPGLNDMMTRMADLFIENYIDPDYLESIPVDEPILIDYTTLSDEEMKELIKCAAVSLTLESDNNRSELLLS
jgi:hypothetical protein